MRFAVERRRLIPQVVGASSFYHTPPFAGGVKADGTFGTALLDTGMKFGKEVR